jgi:endonuclease YncB( thermonuclease family)
VANGVTLVVAPNPAGKPRQDRQLARVRLLGIQTPPPAWEAEAEAFTRAFVWQQEDVQLRLDRRRVDEDGLFLAYVLVNGRLLNAELLRQGLTRSATHPADSGEMVRQLSHAEVEARRLGRGIWAADAALTTTASRRGICGGR